MRLSKGSLDQSGLSVKEYNILKDYYLDVEYNLLRNSLQ